MNNWPIQITLIPETADYFENAKAIMEVPCCKSLTHIVKAAITMSGKNIPLEEIIVSVDGQRR